MHISNRFLIEDEEVKVGADYTGLQIMLCAKIQSLVGRITFGNKYLRYDKDYMFFTEKKIIGLTKSAITGHQGNIIFTEQITRWCNNTLY